MNTITETQKHGSPEKERPRVTTDNQLREGGRESTKSKQDRQKKPQSKHKHTKIIVATQNFNGIRKTDKEGVLEEVKTEMERQGVDILCGQEMSLPADHRERWDTGELLLSFGKDRGDSSRSKTAVAFWMTKKMASAFERGGKQVKRYSSRLATIRIPLVSNKNLYIVNCHFPDSGQTKARQRAFHLQYEAALNAQKHGDILLALGDYNAALGIGEGGEKDVCGPFGIPHTNPAGEEVKTIAGMNQMKDLITYEEQEFYGTWVHPQSKLWHQCDHMFMKERDRYLVKKCINAPMLCVSDHFSLRLHLQLETKKMKKRCVRQERTGKDLTEHFGYYADEEKRAALVQSIVNNYKNGNTMNDQHERLLNAVTNTIDMLPNQIKRKAGWCDLNCEILQECVRQRNEAAQQYARDKSSESHIELKRTRQVLKKAKKVAKNKWLLEQLRDCNRSVLPGGKDQKRQGALWSLTTKLQRGVDKWKPWKRKNIQDKEGVMGTTPEENADNFKAFYDDLFTNDVSNNTQAETLYQQMAKKKQDRSWRRPQMHEMKRAIQELRHTAAGQSGVTACVWKALAKDEYMLNAMLKVIVGVWEEEKVPKDWLCFYMTVLPKKGDLSLPSNYRGISIAETMSKIYTSILKYRLMGVYEQIAPEFCTGFRRGRGRADSIFTAKENLRTRKRYGLESFGIFWDVKKCFDVIPREYIWRSMQVCGIEEKMIRAVKATLDGTTCEMTVDGVTRTVEMKQGSAQGTSLGPTLCLYFFLPILELWQTKMERARITTTATTRNETGQEVHFDTFMHNFADDTLMIVGTREHAVRVVRDFDKFISSFQVEVHKATTKEPKSKSVIIHFPATKQQELDMDKTPIQVNDNTQIHDDRQEQEYVNFVTEYTYLGARITNTLRDDAEIRGRIGKATQMFGCLRKNLLASKDVNGEVKRTIFECMIVPTLLDGAEHWIVTAQMLQELQSAYNKMVRGALRLTTHTTRIHHITTEECHSKLHLHTLQHYLDWKVLAYAGHVQRMHTHRLPQLTRHAYTEGTKAVGGQRKTHDTQLKESLRRKGIEHNKWQQMAMQKQKWKEAITASASADDRNTKMRSKQTIMQRVGATKPTELVGLLVEKKYQHKWYTGEIIDADIDEETGEQIWQVLYDDNEISDYNDRELGKILCEDMKMMFQRV